MLGVLEVVVDWRLTSACFCVHGITACVSRVVLAIAPISDSVVVAVLLLCVFPHNYTRPWLSWWRLMGVLVAEVVSAADGGLILNTQNCSGPCWCDLGLSFWWTVFARSGGVNGLLFIITLLWHVVRGSPTSSAPSHR